MAPKRDWVVLSAFLVHLVAIFVTDVLFLRYRKPRNGAPTSYSENARATPILRLFFIWLAWHTWRRWTWDPVNRVADRLVRPTPPPS